MNTRDRRALQIGLYVLVPALGYIWGVKPLLASFGRMRDEIRIERQALAQELAAVAAAKRNPDLQRVADSAMRAMTPRLFEGKDDVMATAELVSHLDQVARRSNVLLQSAATRPASLDNGVRTLRVEIRGESDLTGLLSFLEALEGGGKLLSVERLDVSRSLAAPEVTGVEPLAIAASIVGFAIPDPTAPPSTPIAEPARPRGAGGRGGTR